MGDCTWNCQDDNQLFGGFAGLPVFLLAGLIAGLGLLRRRGDFTAGFLTSRLPIDGFPTAGFSGTNQTLGAHSRSNLRALPEGGGASWFQLIIFGVRY